MVVSEPEIFQSWNEPFVYALPSEVIFFCLIHIQTLVDVQL